MRFQHQNGEPEILITKKGAVIAAAAALAVPIMAAAPVSAARAATPTVGIGVGGSPWYGYIGDQQAPWPGDFSASYVTTGNAPLAPGQTGTWYVTYTNQGNVPENIAVTQYASGAYTWGQTPVPAGWVSFSPVSAGSVAPGAQVIVKVTVRIPANAKPGLYGGTLMGTASAVQKGSGNITSNVGAGDREYVRVG
jgi:NPCBM-associated, NEW3 domain of alpha-galactosidase